MKRQDEVKGEKDGSKEERDDGQLVRQIEMSQDLRIRADWIFFKLRLTLRTVLCIPMRHGRRNAGK